VPASEKSDQEPRDEGQKDNAVDIERLADRVYRLMVAELRLERSRAGRLDH
jgi:hypothetical protein